MGFPDFFARVPCLTLHDPLAAFLGAAEGGLIEYAYADAVRLAGHSCPTVAGAWTVTVRALRRLYGEATPERGGVEVAFEERQEAGVAGVMASVAGLLTGAAGPGGFKGLGGRHARANLLTFGVEGVTGVRFRRRDSGAAVGCVLNLSAVPPDPRIGELLPGLLAGRADAQQARLFRALWQERVRRILLDHAEDPALVTMRDE
jgi:hypothetical protein